MKLTSIVLLCFVSAGSTIPTLAQRGRCGYDIGNACSLACNVMADDEDDLGVYSASGDYSMSYFHVTCSNPDIVCGYSGDGIVFNQQNGSCPSGSAAISPDLLHTLQIASHSRSVYFASCSGGLYPEIPSKSDSSDPSFVFHSKHVLTRHSAIDSLEGGKQ